MIKGAGVRAFQVHVIETNQIQFGRILELIKSSEKSSELAILPNTAINFLETLHSKMCEIDYLSKDSIAYQNRLQLAADILECVKFISQNLLQDLEFTYREKNDEFFEICIDPLMKISRIYSQVLESGMVEDIEHFQIMRERSTPVYRTLSLKNHTTLASFFEEQLFPVISAMSIERLQQYSPYVLPLFELVKNVLEKFEVIFEDENFKDSSKEESKKNPLMGQKAGVQALLLESALTGSQFSLEPIVVLTCLQAVQSGVENSLYCLEEDTQLAILRTTIQFWIEHQLLTNANVEILLEIASSIQKYVQINSEDSSMTAMTEDDQFIYQPASFESLFSEPDALEHYLSRDSNKTLRQIIQAIPKPAFLLKYCEIIESIQEITSDSLRPAIKTQLVEVLKNSLTKITKSKGDLETLLNILSNVFLFTEPESDEKWLFSSSRLKIVFGYVEDLVEIQNSEKGFEEFHLKNDKESSNSSEDSNQDLNLGISSEENSEQENDLWGEGEDENGWGSDDEIYQEDMHQMTSNLQKMRFDFSGN